MSHLTPEASPDTMGDVRRVNNIPLIICGWMVLGFLLIIVMVMIGRDNRQAKQVNSNSADSVIPYPIGGGIMAADKMLSDNRPALLPASISETKSIPLATRIVGETQTQDGIQVSIHEGKVLIEIPRPFNDSEAGKVEAKGSIHNGRYIVNQISIRFTEEH